MKESEQRVQADLLSCLRKAPLAAAFATEPYLVVVPLPKQAAGLAYALVKAARPISCQEQFPLLFDCPIFYASSASNICPNALCSFLGGLGLYLSLYLFWFSMLQ